MKRLAAILAVSVVTVLVAGAARPRTAAAVACPPRTCGMLSVARPGALVLMLQPVGPGGPLTGYDVRSGRRLFSLPSGLATADGRSFFATANPTGATTLTRFDARTGRRIGRLRLYGSNWLAAVSANGRWASLVDSRSTRRLTVIRVVDTRLRRVARTVRLGGSFEVEAASNDGRRLFLVQHLAGGAYHIRVYDVRRGALRAGTLRPKNEDELMVGYPSSAIASPGGRWLLTLYVKPNERESFVHALDLSNAVAYCLDLPGRATENLLQQYALTLSRDGTRLFAANATLGALAVVDLAARMPTVTSVRRFRPATRAGSRWANASLSPDGRTLYFGTVRALHAYDVVRGRVRGPYRVGPVGGFAFTPDGRRLTVVRMAGRPIWLDAATGRALRA
jgi:hypothetical protein